MTTGQEAALVTSGQAASKPLPGTTIDCDVHPVVAGGFKGLAPYIPRAWNERFARKGAVLTGSAGVPLRFTHPNGTVLREDARGPNGDPAGADPHYLISDLLDGQGVGIALLNCLQAGGMCSAQSQVDESIVLARAYNDFFLEEWLTLDKRLRFAATVPSQDPMAAAEEVRRVAKHPQVAAIALPMVNIQLGNRWYWPIYEAAQEQGLPIFLHVTGVESVIHGAPAITAGTFDSYIDRYLAMPQLAESSLRNLIFSGTFEKFPDLRVIFAEYGFLWVLPLLWRMERLWRGLRHDVPWVKKRPTDYVAERCFFTTQPVDEPDDPRQLETLIGMIGTDQLCFSSDYPHWDNDMPGQTLRFLLPEDRKKVFSENAKRVLRLS